MHRQVSLITVVFLAMLLSLGGAAHAQETPVRGTTSPAAAPGVRVSAWYWLNAAPKSEWARDFKDMKQLGFTDILLCWGVDISAVATRKSDTKDALKYAHDAGIGVYLLIWHPRANSLPHKPEFMQINPEGKDIGNFDVFNPAWRSSQWKDYLQDVVKTYRDEPALSGYAFDDSFGGGTFSYGSWEQAQFGAPLPKKPADDGWERWTKMRQGWWEDWAKDTIASMREIDPNPKHVIYLEDTISSITSAKRADERGLDFARVAKHFDAVSGYTTPKWTADPGSDQKVSVLTNNAIESVRKSIGPNKRIIYTFWSANIAEEMKPGPAVYPTAKQIISICEDAMKLGVYDLDMYGYRIGEYRVSKEDQAKLVPPEPAPYIVTGQFPQKFMWDRPEIHAELGAYLRKLTGPEQTAK